MRIDEIILTEQSVISSWIAGLTMVKGRSGDVTMALGNGRRYLVKGVGSQLYQQWLAAPSKGTFWHENIRNQYRVDRIR